MLAAMQCNPPPARPTPSRHPLPARPQATTLRTLGALHTSLGALLAEDAAQHLKSCDTDVRGCGQPNPVTHELQEVPRVFTLQVGLAADGARQGLQQGIAAMGNGRRVGVWPTCMQLLAERCAYCAGGWECGLGDHRISHNPFWREQVAWQSHSEEPADIAETLAAIRETVSVPAGQLLRCHSGLLLGWCSSVQQHVATQSVVSFEVQ